MSKMSDYLSNIFTTIAGDIKALFSKFDTNGKLIKTNLPALTKSDVGLSNVDNTADINKSVASAGKLATARTISLKGGVTGSASFDGSANVSMTIGLGKFAVREAFGGYDVVSSTSADKLVQNFAIGTKMTASSMYQSDAPFGGYPGVVETFCGVNSSEKLQIAYPFDNSTVVYTPESYFGQRIGFLYRRFPIGNPTADQLKWIPLNSSLLTYRNTTSLPANVYVGTDGVLKRSTYAGSAPVMVSAKLGDSTNGLVTAAAHGLDVSKISRVSARCNTGTNEESNWIPDGFLQPSSVGVQYYYYYTVRATSSILYIEVHPNATQLHGKTIDIFIETTA